MAIKNTRIGTDQRFALSLSNAGKKVNMNDVEVLHLCMYSNDQRSNDGSIGYAVNAEDATVLDLLWLAKSQSFLGSHSVHGTIRYAGAVASFDVPAVNVVSLTSEADISTEPIVLEAPVGTEDLTATITIQGIGPQGPKGPKGDKMTYADLTQEDKKDLYEGVSEVMKPLLATKQNTLTDTDGSYGQRVAELEKEGIASQEKLSELDKQINGVENKISEVETSSATSSDDSIEIVDNDGETIVSVTSEGVDAKEITIGGNSLMKEKDYEIEKIIEGDISNKIEITQDNGDEIVSITPSGINVKEVSVRVGNKYHSLSKNASKSELAFCRAENNFIFPTSTLRDDSVILYKANQHSSNDSHIVNAVSYPNGEIIAAKSDGTIIKIGNDGQETNLLTIPNSYDWRCLFINSNLDVFASPAGSSVSSTNRGLYKLAYNGESFTKVVSLYNPSSSIESETIEVNSSIWTMCEDNKGYLYAGVYQNQTPWNPAIYRSTDGGDTWVYLYNFITSGVCPSGHHIHFVTFNKADMRLYAIVGEYNDVFVSEDSGVSWNSLGVPLKDAKGSAAVPCDSGLVIGSDSAYSCLMHKVYADKSYGVKSRIWANVVFAVRKSDLTGWLYAFTINDASVDSLSYMPPVSAIESEDALNSWKASSPAHLAEWEEYNEMTKDVFPDDAIRPQHCAILISKNDGETWEILYRPSLGTKGGVGFPIAGTFRNGECLVCVQKQEGNQVVIDAPIIISEGVHKYTSNGISVEGRIFSKVVSSNNITRI